jgi:DNA-binding MarR family transcriptional regulator
MIFACILEAIDRMTATHAVGRTKSAGQRIDAGPTDGPDTSRWEITEFLTYRIDVMHRFQIRQTKRMLKRFDLSLAEWRVLNNLSRRSPDTVGAIATRTAIAKSQISRAAAALAARGLVRRAENPVDGRTPMFNVTTAGRRLCEKVLAVGRDRQRRLLADFAPAQREMLFDAIAVLTERMRGNA